MELEGYVIAEGKVTMGRTVWKTPFQGRSVIAVASYWVSLGDPFHPEARGRTLTLPGLPLRATGGGSQCINTRALQCPDVELVWATECRHIWNIAGDSALWVPFSSSVAGFAKGGV